MMTTEERFLLKVQKTPGCWVWLGGKNPEGYGRFFVDGRMVGPHRYSYELYKGDIPPKLYLDHLCRVPACVNPDHLEPVTNRENQARGKNCTERKKNGLPVGVRIHGRKFKATMMINGVRCYLGLYPTAEEAARKLQDNSGAGWGA